MYITTALTDTLGKHMILSHITKHPQLPGKVVINDYTGTDFVCKSGKVLKVRRVKVSDTLTLCVPHTITRQNFHVSHTGTVNAQWTLAINGVNLYFRDRDDTPTLSLLAAVEILYNMADAPTSVLRALKTNRQQERQRKNVNTGIPGIGILAVWNKELQSFFHMVRCSVQLNGSRYQKSISFDYKDVHQVHFALSVMTSFRQQLLENGITDRPAADALLDAMRRGLVPAKSYPMTQDILDQITDNVTMRTSMLTDKGWTNPYTGAYIDGYEKC